MSRYRIGLLTAVILIGVGLAVCLAALTDTASTHARAAVASRNPAAPFSNEDSREVLSPPSTKADAESPSEEPNGNVCSAHTSPKRRDPAEVLTVPGPVWAQPHPSITYQVQPPQDESALMDLLRTMTERLGAEAGPPRAEAAGEAGAESRTAPLPPSGEPAAAEAIPAPVAAGKVDDLGNRRFLIQFQNEDIRRVLEAISNHAGLNIVVSDAVQGTVTANFAEVDVMEALDAILKSTGFLARKEGNFVFVGAPDDFVAMEKTLDQLGTRIYRPNYVTATELQTLITPMLSEGAGFVSISTAAEVGIAADESNAGGNAFAGEEVLLIRDYSAVLAEVDQIIAEVDTKPLQVAIEATILSVKLDDSTKMGVSFEFLRNYPNVRFGIGTPANELPKTLDNGGLEFAFLDGSLGAFIEALETVQDTNVIATPRVMVLNKHRAEVQIGKSDGYVNSTVTETSTSQSVAFLDTGTILRIRPFISSDGLIRMELHPELSTGEVQISQQFTIPKKEVTQVTTNVMVRDGCTVIIGGLIREQLSSGASQVPFLGSLPLVGPVFRSKQNQGTVREEIMILLTPHILREPEMCEEGAHVACEFHRRRDVMAEKTTPLSRDRLSQQYFRLAQNAWAQGDRDRALRYAEMSVHFHPGNRAAIDLRSDIWMNESQGGHTLIAPQALPEPAAAVDDNTLPPWVLQGLAENKELPSPPASSGEKTFSRNITKPGGWR
ncbi:MAG: hypothetical protein GXX96_19685 [Planctomycetaceae bacterium]|nr:hypothetical protein [Planctomycetaceae bacterium]